jgi:hypothetical protein
LSRGYHDLAFAKSNVLKGSKIGSKGRTRIYQKSPQTLGFSNEDTQKYTHGSLTANAGLRCVVEAWDTLHSLAPWQVISHLTFAWEASIWSGARCYEKFMRSELRGVSYFYALEQNPGRDGYHVHALWVDCKNMRRTDIWRTWFGRCGRARIEPVNSRDDVADYCAKYVTKENSWCNVKLLSHRHPQFATDFILSQATQSQ